MAAPFKQAWSRVQRTIADARNTILVALSILVVAVLTVTILERVSQQEHSVKPVDRLLR